MKRVYEDFSLSEEDKYVSMIQEIDFKINDKSKYKHYVGLTKYTNRNDNWRTANFISQHILLCL